jgi:protein-disulfide isomerase
MSDRLSTAFLGLAAISAAIVAALTIQSRLSTAGTPNTSIPEDRRLENWSDLITTGHRIGSPNAKITILEFADFECPACRGFALSTMKELRARYPDQVALVYRHWPLPYHRFARPAALASECAAEQGHFEEYHDVLFAKQDSLGLKSFLEFAKEAGVPDTFGFEECIRLQKHSLTVDADAAVPIELEAVGTPTIAVNGVLYGSVPRIRDLITLIERK